MNKYTEKETNKLRKWKEGMNKYTEKETSYTEEIREREQQTEKVRERYN